MKFQIEIGGRTFHVDPERGQSIAIRMQFGGPQPNHFGVAPAQTETVRVGDFVGDTRLGGSCNVDHLSLIPHCNGTHTESVEHIVNQEVPVGDLLLNPWSLARVVSVPLTAARETAESYRPELDHHDTVVTAAALNEASQSRPFDDLSALIIRTLPNRDTKKTVAWGNPDHPAFLTVEAMEWIVARSIRHLLLDLPSVDKMYDEGLLTNHHIFWNVPEGTHDLVPETRTGHTITEMVMVEDEIQDGDYLLNLQIPAFVADAAPSRPLLFPLDG